MCRLSPGAWHAGKRLLKFTHKVFGGNEDVAADAEPFFQPSPGQTQVPSTLPFHFSAPEDVLLFVHEDGEMLVFALLYGV